MGSFFAKLGLRVVGNGEALGLDDKDLGLLGFSMEESGRKDEPLISSTFPPVFDLLIGDVVFDCAFYYHHCYYYNII